MRKFKKYVLIDEKGNVLAEGRKKDVFAVMSNRYVYEHIYSDKLYIVEK